MTPLTPVALSGGNIEIIHAGNTLWIQHNNCCVLRIQDFESITSHGIELELRDSPTAAVPEGQPVPPTDELISLDEMDRRHTLGTLEKLGWNKSQTAETLGIQRSTLDRKLKRWNANRPTATA